MRRSLIIFTMITVLAIGLAGTALAAEFRHGQATTQVAQGQTVDDDLFISGSSVRIEGTVHGDVYALGRSVDVSGTVDGNVFALARDVVVGGTVGGSVITAGQTVRLAGSHIGDGVTAAGTDLSSDSGTTLGGGALLAGQGLDWRAKTGRGVTAAASDITLGGPIGRNVNVQTGSLNLANGTAINGNLTYNSGQNLTRESNASVTGQIRRIEPKKHNQPQHHGPNLLLGLWGLVASLAVGCILLWIAPALSRGVPEMAARRPWASLGWGFLTLILTIPLVILMLITVIGIPLAILTVIAFAMALYLAHIFVAMAVGSQILKSAKQSYNRFAVLTLGLVVLFVVELIPFLGGLIRFLVLLFGLGAIVVYLYSRHRPAASKPAKA
jgi:cytoskeletal protein CcmA (bactofilin family)